MYIFPLEKIRQSLSNKYPKGFSYVYLEECFEDSSTTEELSGVKQPIIARMEKGHTNAQIETILKILAPLGKTLAVVPIS